MTRTRDDDTHPVLPGCEPWLSPEGGPHGALVLHGFTGNPLSMRGMAEALADAGFAVSLPRLPGHGTAIDDLVPTRFSDWLAEAERALGALQARVADGRVIVVGLSMGGALTLALGETHPELAGIVCINTLAAAPEGLAQGLAAMAKGGVEIMDAVGGDIADPEVEEGAYDGAPVAALASLLEASDELRANLGQIGQPVLIVTSRQDHVVSPTDSDIIAEGVAGPVERIWLERSFHVATMDFDKTEIEAATVAFAQRVTA